jgi:hypothetical protein
MTVSLCVARKRNSAIVSDDDHTTLPQGHEQRLVLFDLLVGLILLVLVLGQELLHLLCFPRNDILGDGGRRG